jgi:hypothetical protein
VFGRKERDQFHALRFVEYVDRLSSFTIASGVIRDQADSHSGKLLEVVALEHVDSCQHLCRAAKTFIARGELLQAFHDFAVVSRRLLSRTFDGHCISD